MAVQPKLVLYSSHASGCSQRLWIALAYKQLAHEIVTIDPATRSSKYKQNVNPSARVPTLHATYPDGRELWLKNSITALRWLDEAFPQTPQLVPGPDDWNKRALVLDLFSLTTADTQPVQNSRICRRAGEVLYAHSNDGEDRDEAVAKGGQEWRRMVIRDYLESFEAMIAGYAGRFAVGDDFTLADLVLYPQMLNGFGVGMTLDEYPTLSRIWKNIIEHHAIQAGDASRQPDHPSQVSK